MLIIVCWTGVFSSAAGIAQDSYSTCALYSARAARREICWLLGDKYHTGCQKTNVMMVRLCRAFGFFLNSSDLQQLFQTITKAMRWRWEPRWEYGSFFFFHKFSASWRAHHHRIKMRQRMRVFSKYLAGSGSSCWSSRLCRANPGSLCNGSSPSGTTWHTNTDF